MTTLLNSNSMAKKSHIELLNSPSLFTKYEETERGRGVIASPLEYEELMKVIPRGMLITVEELKQILAKKHKVNYACPQATGFYINMVANAAKEKELLGGKQIVPYWRTLKKNGQLNERYPGGIEAQRRLLESEGHIIVQKGGKSVVADYSNKLFRL